MKMRPVDDTGYPLWYWLRMLRQTYPESPLKGIEVGKLVRFGHRPKWYRCNELLYRYVRRYPFAVKRDDHQAILRVYLRGGSTKPHDPSLYEKGSFSNYGYFHACQYNPDTGYWTGSDHLPDPPWTKECEVCGQHLPATAFALEWPRWLMRDCRNCARYYSHSQVRARLAHSMGIDGQLIPGDFVAASQAHLRVRQLVKRMRKEQHGIDGRRETGDEHTVLPSAQKRNRPENGGHNDQHCGEIFEGRASEVPADSVRASVPDDREADTGAAVN